MPGIAGIISPRSAIECRRLVELMTESMKHEPFYTSGALSVPEMGVYSGWVAMEGSFAAKQIFFNKERDIVLVFAGECFAESRIADLGGISHVLGNAATHWLVALYEHEGVRFVEKLNGLFSGLLIDKRKRQAFLFNDRYGVERIYWVETPDGFFFASEAKAILQVRPECRAFDDEGVSQFLNFGCTVEERTLFRNISTLPGASRWTFANSSCRKERYFSPDTWESQSALTEEEFDVQFQETFKRILPRYFDSNGPLGMSLTAGLDTRMIMACRPENAGKPICFTYSGEHVDTLDARIAARIAAACGLEHHALHIGPDFFSNFAELADRTVYLTDGCFGVTGAHEIYMSRLARQLAPLRLTGNFGGEVLRGVSTFKPVPPAAGLICHELREAMALSAKRLEEWKEHQITFAAFREVPWNLFGNLQAGRSQIGFRTPYLDNELVAIAYRAPEGLRRSRRTALRLVRENNPALSAIPTDKAYLGTSSGPGAWLRRTHAKLTFKLDYLNNEGFPHWLSRGDPLFQNVASRLGLLGLHKHLHYRSWFRRELSGYVKESLSGLCARTSPFWNANFLESIGRDHISGRRNYVSELNAVLTLETVERLLFQGLRREPESARVSELLPISPGP